MAENGSAGPADPATPAQGAPFPRQFRSHYSRTKSGCLNCRKRRKRCDEKKPVCSACLRNTFNCSWPELNSESLLNQDLPATEDPVTTKVSLHFQESQNLDTPRVSSSCSSTIPNSHCQSSFVPLRTHQTSSISGNDYSGSIHTLVPSPITVVPQKFSPSRFLGLQRATLLSPHSSQLLTHYIERTSHMIAAKNPSHNNFVTIVLPLANTDDLLMHAVLAASGAQLGDLNESTSIQRAASAHYGIVLRSLRQELSTPLELSVAQNLRLLLVLNLLCHVEAMSGNTHGAIFFHLRMMRQLILDIRRRSRLVELHEHKRVLGFVTEVYAYLALVSNITPYGVAPERTLPLDSFITSLETLKEYDDFGTFFSCSPEIFEMIPCVSVIAARRIHEVETGLISEETSRMHENLLHRLEQWQSPPINEDMAEWEQAHIATGNLYRQALFAYLKGAMCGPIVNSPKTIHQIQQHIDKAWPLMPQVADSPYGTTLIWPLLIIGSLLVRDDQRSFMRQTLESPGQWRMSQTIQASQLLQQLWDSDNQYAYGPYGLHLTMKEHEINFCTG